MDWVLTKPTVVIVQNLQKEYEIHAGFRVVWAVFWKVSRILESQVSRILESELIDQ